MFFERFMTMFEISVFIKKRSNQGRNLFVFPLGSSLLSFLYICVMMKKTHLFF